jgi:hypothetical protein
VLVVGVPSPLTATAIAQAEIATPNPPQLTAGTGIPGGLSGTSVPAVGSQGAVGTQNPNTSAGIPLMGFVLFGLTLLVHNVRVRRELTHI